MECRARQKPISHYNPVDRSDANEELFVIALCNQSPKRKRGAFDRSLALAALMGH